MILMVKKQQVMPQGKRLYLYYFCNQQVTLATKQEDTTRPLQPDLSPLPRRLLPPRVQLFIWISSLFSFISVKL